MTPEKQELIIRMENLLNMPYNYNPYFKTNEIWRSAIASKLKELKSNKIK